MYNMYIYICNYVYIYIYIHVQTYINAYLILSVSVPSAAHVPHCMSAFVESVCSVVVFCSSFSFVFPFVL